MPALDSKENVDEYLGMVEDIEKTNFASLPVLWRSKSDRTVERSPMRVGPGSDYVYYEPHVKQYIDEKTDRERVGVERVIPDGHPMGYEFDGCLKAGWRAKRFVGDEEMRDEPMVEAEIDDDIEGVSGWGNSAMIGAVDAPIGSAVRSAVVECVPDAQLEEVKHLLRD